MVDPNHQAIRHKLMQLLAQHFLSYGSEGTAKLTKPKSGAVQVKQNKQFPFSRYGDRELPPARIRTCWLSMSDSNSTLTKWCVLASNIAPPLPERYRLTLW